MKTDPSFRSDFEVAILFHPDITKRGFTARRADGTYADPDAERMYLGYCIARQNDYAQLKRFDPGRPLPAGLVTHINKELMKRGQLHVTLETVRTILAAVGDSPV